MIKAALLYQHGEGPLHIAGERAGSSAVTGPAAPQAAGTEKEGAGDD